MPTNHLSATAAWFMKTDTEPMSVDFNTTGEGHPDDMGTRKNCVDVRPTPPAGNVNGTVAVKTPDNCQGRTPYAFAIGGDDAVDGWLKNSFLPGRKLFGTILERAIIRPCRSARG